MNNARRKIIALAIEKLEEIKSLLEDVTEDERNAFENMPESLQGGERGVTMENIIDSIESHVSTIEDVIAELEEF